MTQPIDNVGNLNIFDELAEYDSQLSFLMELQDEQIERLASRGIMQRVYESLKASRQKQIAGAVYRRAVVFRSHPINLTLPLPASVGVRYLVVSETSRTGHPNRISQLIGSVGPDGTCIPSHVFPVEDVTAVQNMCSELAYYKSIGRLSMLNDSLTDIVPPPSPDIPAANQPTEA